MRLSHATAAIVASALGIGTFAQSSNAAITLFDNTVAPNWGLGQWDSSVQAGTGRSGSAAISAGGGGTIVRLDNNTGVVVGDDHLLDFWLNTSVNTAFTGLQVRINFFDASDNVERLDVPFATRNGSRTYTVDGMDVLHSNSLGTDANNTTWQNFQLDLSQNNYVWGGSSDVPLNFDPATDTLKRVLIRQEDGSGGNLLVDDVRLISNAAPVPEPATLGLVSFAGLVALRRRRTA